MKLIDAQKFKYYVYDKWNKNEITNEEAIQFREWLKDQEAVIETNDDITRVVVRGVEYMPVIRCSECKHRHDIKECPRCYGALHSDDNGITIWYDTTVDSGFCEKGERKEE